jgi:hypothetical protein
MPAALVAEALPPMAEAVASAEVLPKAIWARMAGAAWEANFTGSDLLMTTFAMTSTTGPSMVAAITCELRSRAFPCGIPLWALDAGYVQEELKNPEHRIIPPKGITLDTAYGALLRLEPGITFSKTPGYWEIPGEKVLAPRGAAQLEWADY